MVLRAFVDESEGEDGTFVLAGHIADVGAWAHFAEEWKDLLPSWGTLRADGERHFKMSEMAQLDERMERVPAFYRVWVDSSPWLASGKPPLVGRRRHRPEADLWNGREESCPVGSRSDVQHPFR
jgi:hypothetical protein